MRIVISILKGLLPLIVLGLAGLAATMMIRSRPEVEIQSPTVAPPGVRVHQTRLETVQVGVTSQGTVRPRTETQIVPEVSGRVTWVSPSFAEGGFFEEGEVLLRIDRFDYEQAVVTARSQLAQARLRLAQEEAEAEVAQREWEALGLGDPRELTLRKPQLEEARASVAAAEANVVRAQRDLERADITAPYAGRVRTKNVDIGQFVTVGATIASIYAVDVAEIRLPLPDEELAFLDLPLSYRGSENQPGPRVVIRATFAGSTYEWRGRVVRTESEIDPVSRMVHVIAEVQDPYAHGPDPRRPPLAVGMYVEAEIEGRAFTQIAVVPRAAIRGANRVIVIDGESRVRFREVEILRSTTDSVYVERGLSEGELVAVSALDGPTDGMLVLVSEARGGQLTDASAPGAPAPGLPVPPPSTATTSVREVQAEAQSASGFAAEQPGWLRELLADAPASATPARRRTAAATSPASARPGTGRAASALPEPASEAPHDTDLISDREERTAPAPSARSESSSEWSGVVAVLPFEEITRGGRAAEVSAGLAESVSMELANVAAITVVPSATDANWVVGGGVQTLGDAVRVTAQVTDRRDGHVLSAIKIDGVVSDLPGVRAEVATAIRDSIIEVLGLSDTAPVVQTPVGAISVLPFANVSQMPEDTALVMAIMTAITDRIAGLSTVRLVSSERDARWIISGGIQHIGSLVRITARLIDAREGAVVRGLKVDGPVDQVMRLQNEVALELSNSVREVTS